MREVNLRRGIDESIEILGSTKERPILCSVYGWPNSGKSYFMEGLSRYFKSQEMDVYCGECAPNKMAFELLRDRPSYLRDLMLFHCGWARMGQQGKAEVFLEDEDPNFLAERLAGRKLHLNVRIYNPCMESLRGDFEPLEK